MDITSIYKQIVQRNYTWCKVLQGKDQKLLLSWIGTDARTPEDIVKELREYFNDFPGTYKILLKRKPTDQSGTITTYTVSVNDFQNDTSEQTKIHNSNYSVSDIKKLKDQLRKELIGELVADKKKNDLVEELKKQKKKTEELDMVAGKISYLVSAIFSNLPGASGVLGGTNNNNTITSLMTEPLQKPINEYTPAEKNAANEALVRFLAVTNPDFLLEMAKKLQAKPELVNTLKSFL